MADNTENIGGVNVTIGADLSDLQAGFSQAQTDAQAAGAAIADAFASAGSTGLADFDAAIQAAVTSSDTLASSADEVGASVDGAGSQASAAAGDVQNFGTASETAGTQAAESANSFSEMAENLTLIGEALIITDGLKEFGADALEAADNVTHASIALTQMDGSAAAAQTTISGLEDLGMSDGLSFPSLLVAGTRMTAVLGPGVDVSNLLGQIADGAAVMGTDIETAATKFDQMATAGTASARTLTQLGLSLGSLATALNTVNGNQDATAASAAAMFKALDQSDRITVLQTALQGLAGTAEKAAESTFGGQWQELANSWDSLMVEAGQDLLPVISELVSFTKVEIIPFLKDMLAGFSALPAPVQQIVIGVALLAAALIPVSAALAAVGLGITGLNTLLDTLGVTSAEAATATEGLATAQTEAVASAEELAVAEGEVAASEETVAATTTASSASIASAIGGRILLYGALAAALLDLYGAYEKEQQAETGAAAQNNELYTSLNKLEGLMVSQGIDIQGLTSKYASGEITIDQLLSSLNQLEVGFTQANGAIQNSATDAGAMTTSLTALIATVNSQNDAVRNAQINVDALTSAYNNNRTLADGTVVTTQMLTAAQNQLNSALQASGVNLKNQAAIAAASTAALQMLGGTSGDVTHSLGLLSLATFGTQQQFALAALAGQTWGIQMLTNESQISALNKASGSFGVTIMQQPTELLGLSAALTDAQNKLASVTAAWEAGTATANSYLQAVKAATAAQEAFDVAQAEAAANTSGATDAVSLYTAILAGAQAKLTDVTNDYLNQTATAQQLLSAQKAVTQAQNDLNNAMGAAASPLATATSNTVNLGNANTAAVPAINSATAAMNAQAQAAMADSAAVADMMNSIGSLSNVSVTGPANGKAAGVSYAFGSPGEITQFLASVGLDPNVSIGAAAAELGAQQLTATQVAQALANQKSNSGVVVDSLNPNPVIPPGTGTTGTGTTGTSSTTSTGGTTSGTSTLATSGVSLIDEESSGTLYGQLDDILTALTGGTFSNLTTATQNLATATTANTDATTASITATDTAAAASTSISSVLSGTVSTLQIVGTSIGGLSTSLQQLSGAVTKNVTGQVGTVSSTGTSSQAGTTGGGGTISVGNTPVTVYLGSPGQTGVTGTDTNNPNATQAPTVNMHFEGATFGSGVTATQVAQAVTPMVMQAMTQVLRTSGARF